MRNFMSEVLAGISTPAAQNNDTSWRQSSLCSTYPEIKAEKQVGFKLFRHHPTTKVPFKKSETSSRVSLEIIFHNKNYSHVLSFFLSSSSKWREQSELVLSLNDQWEETVMLQWCLYSVHAVESVWIMKITFKNKKPLLPSLNLSPSPVSDLASTST